VLSVFISFKQRASLSFYVLQERFSRGIRPPTIPELATWDICSGSWHIARDRTRLLAQAREKRVQSTTSIRAYFHKGEVQFRGLCIHFDQVTNPFQLLHAPNIFFAWDQTIDNYPYARNACRHDERKIRTTCGKCPTTAPTDHPPSTGQTPRLFEDRSVSPGGSCQNGSDLEKGAFPRPARDASAVAS
jgi:hypothetical protein